MSLVPINRRHSSNILDRLDYYPPYYNFSKRPYYWDDSILWHYPLTLFKPMDELIVRRVRNQLIRSSLNKWSYPMLWDNHYNGEHINVDNNGFRVDIDVSAYEPHEIQIKTTDDYIMVEGQHTQKTLNGHHMIEKNFTRKYLLPRGLNPNDIITDLSSNGILTIKVLPPPTKTTTTASMSKPRTTSERLFDYNKYNKYILSSRPVSIIETGWPILHWK